MTMSTTRETVLEVEGMSCGSCVRHVDEALRTVDGVTAVEVRLKEGRVLVRHDDDAPLPQLVEALRDAGYPARAA
jgi:copper chaperone